MAAPELKFDDAYWERLAEEYKDRMRENPRSYVYVPLADALVYLGRINEAIEALSWGLTHLPESRAAKIMLAELLYDIGDVTGARLLLEDVVARWPDLLEAASLLCRIYETEGNIETAGMLAESLLDYYPNSSSVKEMVEYYARQSPSRAPEPPERAPAPVNMENKLKKDGELSALETILENIDHLKVEKDNVDG
ncbi:MAG: tetratricopeptide repeat protein [Nitrospinota bacterium]|nr:tetratricopeptide repeat protein [Nitrospinota bacterium]